MANGITGLAAAAALAIGMGGSARAAPAWQADWGADSCSLFRIPDPGQSITLGISRTPGGSFTYASLLNKAWAKASGDAAGVVLTLDPGGAVPVQAFYSPNSDRGPALTMEMPGRAFLEQLARARSLSVAQNGVTIATYTLPQAAPAVKSLSECERTALVGWGVDTDAVLAARTPPVPKRNLASLVEDDDYPKDALRAGKSGVAVTLVLVDAAGAPVDCKLLKSSGADSIDRQTCFIFMRRARFSPAIGADGQPMAAPYVARLSWMVGP